MHSSKDNVCKSQCVIVCVCILTSSCPSCTCKPINDLLRKREGGREREREEGRERERKREREEGREREREREREGERERVRERERG